MAKNYQLVNEVTYESFTENNSEVTVNEDTSVVKTVKNPKTGIEINYFVAVIIISLSSSIYFSIRKIKKIN